MATGKGWTLRQRAIALTVVVGVILAGLGGVAAYTAAESREGLRVLLDKTGPMRVAGESLQSALLDQETAVRGYALTADVEDLTPYRSGSDTEQKIFKQMSGLLGDSAEDNQVRLQLEAVEAGAREWRSVIAEPVIAAVQSGDRERAQQIIDQAAASGSTCSARTCPSSRTTSSRCGTSSRTRRSRPPTCWCSC